VFAPLTIKITRELETIQSVLVIVCEHQAKAAEAFGG